MNPIDKHLILGTALWGSSVDQMTAFDLMDAFYQGGFRWMDTATNYPIDKNTAHFRRAEQIMAEWARSRQVNDLRIIVKIGSLTNNGEPHNDLSSDYIRRCRVHYDDLFASNLESLWLHWDNRESVEEIRDTLDALAEDAPNQPLGISGIKNPLLYAEIAQDMDLRFRIQIKHNVLFSGLSHYVPLAGRAAYYAYGMNAGGLSLSSSVPQQHSIRMRSVEPSSLDPLRAKLESLIQQSQTAGEFEMRTFNQIGLTYAYGTPGIEGLIIGPSTRAQLDESMVFFKRLETGGSESQYARIAEMVMHKIAPAGNV